MPVASIRLHVATTPINPQVGAAREPAEGHLVALFYAACFGHAHVRESLDPHGGTAVDEPAVGEPAVERQPGEGW
jgi:hypothetical protein